MHSSTHSHSNQSQVKARLGEQLVDHDRGLLAQPVCPPLCLQRSTDRSGPPPVASGIAMHKSDHVWLTAQGQLPCWQLCIMQALWHTEAWGASAGPVVRAFQRAGWGAGIWMGVCTRRAGSAVINAPVRPQTG